ncbi:MAG: Na+/H+ antiporter subunit E [Anaerolineae bacterium]|nr:Na+/H+ antiporter subunit E [Anaerolineae bacterium]
MFLLNVLLALAWTALLGEITGSNLLIGFLISYALLAFLARPLQIPTTYFARAKIVVGFVLFFLWELVKANLRVAYDVMTPTQRAKPGVIAVPLDLKTAAQITLLANLITLTPGTLTLDISEDRRFIYIHAMYIDDVEEVKRSIKQGFERRVLELFQ